MLKDVHLHYYFLNKTCGHIQVLKISFLKHEVDLLLVCNMALNSCKVHGVWFCIIP